MLEDEQLPQLLLDLPSFFSVESISLLACSSAHVLALTTGRDGSGPGESGYSSKPAPFGPGMDYTYWMVDGYGDTCINPRGDGGGDGLTLTPAPSPLPVK